MPVIKRFGTESGYTVIENECLHDLSLDIAERGLLVTMLSLPEGWEFSGIGLTSILPCGKSKVYSTLKKLEDAGYLRRTRITDGKGRIVDWRYDICGRPIFRKTEDEITKKEPLTDFREVDKNANKNPLTDFQDLENRDLENWKVAKDKLNNNKINNNPINQSSKDNNNINNNTYRCAEMDSIDKIDKKEIKAEIQKQLNYEQLISKHADNKKQINSIVNILADVISSRSKNIRIAGENKPLEEVIQRFKELTDKHIAYVLECLNKNSNKPRNIKAYLLTSLFNAPSTIDCYYARDANPGENKQYSFDIEEIKSLANSFQV